MASQQSITMVLFTALAASWAMACNAEAAGDSMLRDGASVQQPARRSLLVSKAASADIQMVDWDAWKGRMGRSYPSPEAEAHAAAAFKENIKLIQQHHKTDKPINLADYKFADMTWEDFEKHYLSSMRNMTMPAGMKSVNASSITTTTTTAATGTGTGVVLHQEDSSPASKRRVLFEGPRTIGNDYLSWADKRKYRTPVRDQGSCGSCWSFAAIHALEYAYSIQIDRQGRIPSGYKAAQFSIQQVLECFTDGLGACGWGSAAEFYNQLTRKQIVSESYYPLVSNRNGGVVGGCNTASVSAGLAANSDVQYVAATAGYIRLEGAGRDALLQQLQTSPVVCHFEVDVQFMIWNANSNPVYSAGTCSGNNLNHAVVIVGYDMRTSPPSWIIKNSWGPNWGGLKGYIRVAMTDGDGTCGMYKWCFRPDTQFQGGNAVTYTDDNLDDGLFDTSGSSGGGSARSPNPPRPPRPPRPPPRRRNRKPSSRRLAE